MQLNFLTKEEERVILEKGTEKPFEGEYDAFFEDGLYLCRRCDAPLYESKNKFDAKCGWPSFDDEVKGSIKRKVDADGKRSEVLCSKCGAHLGHIFTGENLTSKNLRHCVNSVSLRFIPRNFLEDEENIAVFSGGCFWSVNAIFSTLKGVASAISGYAGGYTKNPTYEEVKTGETGYAESVKIIYDPEIITYKDLLEIFFYVHNPTILNRQGDDTGSQYRSAIFYKTLSQKEDAEKKIKELEDKKIFQDKIVTEVNPLIEFYSAEEYHQKYFEKNPSATYCQLIIDPKIEEFQKKFINLIKK